MKARRRSGSWGHCLSSLLFFLGVLALSGCSSSGSSTPLSSLNGNDAGQLMSPDSRYAAVSDSYPEDPPNVSQVADAVPVIEPKSPAGNPSRYEVRGVTYQVLPDAQGYVGEGLASWYGEKFHGYTTSNGEIYDMYEMTAAHKTLPLPTFARVTHLGNGRSVVVRINDRGPFHPDREIDLSYAAAYRLGVLNEGVGQVRVEAISPQQDVASSSLDERSGAPTAKTSVLESRWSGRARQPSSVFLQVAALNDRATAWQMQTALGKQLQQPVRVAKGNGMYRVQVGPVEAIDSDGMRQRLREMGYPAAFIAR